MRLCIRSLGLQNVGYPDSCQGLTRAALEHDVFTDRQRLVLEHRAKRQIQPVAKCAPLVDIRNPFDAKADFSKVTALMMHAYSVQAQAQFQLGFGGRRCGPAGQICLMSLAGRLPYIAYF